MKCLHAPPKHVLYDLHACTGGPAGPEEGRHQGQCGRRRADGAAHAWLCVELPGTPCLNQNKCCFPDRPLRCSLALAARSLVCIVLACACIEVSVACTVPSVLKCSINMPAYSMLHIGHSGVISSLFVTAFCRIKFSHKIAIRKVYVCVCHQTTELSHVKLACTHVYQAQLHIHMTQEPMHASLHAVC